MMDFPAVERIVFENNPLTEVICQLRFPRVLVIDERLPAEFQEQLGAEYRADRAAALARAAVAGPDRAAAHLRLGPARLCSGARALCRGQGWARAVPRSGDLAQG